MIIFIVIVFALFIYYDPNIDITRDKIILWYNKKGCRKYTILWSKKK